MKWLPHALAGGLSISVTLDPTPPESSGTQLVMIEPYAYTMMNVHNAPQILFKLVDGSKNDIRSEVRWLLRS
jgi:hypothetical protein